MTEEDKIKLVENRIRFLSVWKEICTRRKAFEPMMKIFHILEADYDKCLVPINDSDKFYCHFKSSDKRIISTKLGKYLVKNYKDMVPADHILSDFVASLNAIIWKELPSIIVYKGDDLITAYKRCNHSKGVSSCMTKKERPSYLKVLAQNPNKVELHCFEDAEDIYSRVLVWTTDDGKKIVDRIYPNTGDNFYKMLEHFQKQKNHYIRKKHTVVTGPSPIVIEGAGNITVTLNCTGIDHYPYLDTMRFGVINNNTLLLTNRKTDKTKLFFNNQYGNPNTI